MRDGREVSSQKPQSENPVALGVADSLCSSMCRFVNCCVIVPALETLVVDVNDFRAFRGTSQTAPLSTSLY